MIMVDELRFILEHKRATFLQRISSADQKKSSHMSDARSTDVHLSAARWLVESLRRSRRSRD